MHRLSVLTALIHANRHRRLRSKPVLMDVSADSPEQPSEPQSPAVLDARLLARLGAPPSLHAPSSLPTLHTDTAALLDTTSPSPAVISSVFSRLGPKPVQTE